MFYLYQIVKRFLFPAWAGVILVPYLTYEEFDAVPRMGGGDPREVVRW